MRPLPHAALAACTFALAFAPTLAAQTTPELRIVPARIQLDHGRDEQRAVAFAARADGVLQALDAAVAWSLAEPTLAELRAVPHGVLLLPKRDGDTELIARWNDRELRVPVAVRRSAEHPPQSFRNDVLPTLTAAGCNTGSCHGAAAGKNGFGLTLFGFDPARDHRVLTRDLRGRRIDLAAPEQSLLLQKATASATHQGGKRFATDSASYQRVLDWIAGGADDDGDRAIACTGIEVEPSSAVVIGAGSVLPLSVRAHFADGSDRDVTTLALWSSGNDAVARVAQGELTALSRGEAAILARYHGHAQIARVRVHLDDTPFTWTAANATNVVDEHVFARLRAARTLPLEPCSDAVFVRRLSLALLSVLPTADATRAFLDDTRADKRERLIDELLARPEFALAQAAMWADVLQIDAAVMEKKGASLLGNWLRDAFAQHRPFDQVVRELLTASGPSFAVAAANFQLIAAQPQLVAEKTAQVFLGVRLQCAQCHNHPFERWTMDDYYGFAAFFAQVGKKRGLDPYEQVIWDRGDGEVRNLRTGAISAPRLLGAAATTLPAGVDRRQVLAEWLTAKDNPWFARNVVNRVWARLLGRGIVEPVDDVRIGNPPAQPELLDALAALFVASNFDVRPVVRAIVMSRTWQAAQAPSDAEAGLFQGFVPRRLAAEPLLDAIAAVTAVPTKYPGVPLGQPATALDGGRGSVRFLDAFGRPARDSACTCDRRDEPTLGQTLHLINGETIAAKVADAQGRLRKALAQKQPPEQMLEDLFLAAYCRRPSLREEERLLAVVQDSKDAAAAWQDLYWSVLNSKEFLFQH